MELLPPVAAGESITVELTGGVEDIYGMSLAPTAWSFRLAEWIRLGKPAGPDASSCHASAFDVGPDGLPVAIYALSRTGDHPSVDADLFIKKWDGTRWQHVGAATRKNKQQGDGWTIAVAAVNASSEGITLGWMETHDSGLRHAYLERWDGAAWIPDPHFQDNEGLPTMIRYDAAGTQYLLKRYEQSNRVTIQADGSLRLNHPFNDLDWLGDIAMNQSGQALFAGREPGGAQAIRYWDGGGAISSLPWLDYERAVLNDVAISHIGVPHMAATFDILTKFELHVLTWFNGQWATLSGPMHLTTTSTPKGLSLALADDLPSGRATVAFFEDVHSRRIIVKRIDAGKWSELPPLEAGPDQEPTNTWLHLLPNGEPMVVWNTFSGFTCQEAALYNGLFQRSIVP